MKKQKVHVSLCVNTAIMNNFRRTSQAHAERRFHLLINPPEDVEDGVGVDNKQSWKILIVLEKDSVGVKRGGRESREVREP